MATVMALYLGTIVCGFWAFQLFQTFHSLPLYRLFPLYHLFQRFRAPISLSFDYIFVDLFMNHNKNDFYFGDRLIDISM